MSGETASTRVPELVDLERYRQLRRSEATAPKQALEIPAAESSTSHRDYELSARERERQVVVEIARLAKISEEEVFEDGMENALSRGLQALVIKSGGLAIRALRSAYVSQKIEGSIFEEAIRWLGTMEDGETRDERQWLFFYGLKDKDKRVKDAATLALSWMEDSSAVPYLESAAEEEQLPILKSHMVAAAAELRQLHGK